MLTLPLNTYIIILKGLSFVCYTKIRYILLTYEHYLHGHFR